ncbi:MAG TPA: [protein-PII] uridylyltransferase [Rhizomicrobium sp.]|nr:[protein-PII] uridylyltransferase [Rhizomicrobium sp.]
MGFQKPERIDLLDAEALRRDLTALAHAQSDPLKLRGEAQAQLKRLVTDARGHIQTRVESGAMPGVAAARALSDIQDLLIRVLYDFTSKHFYRAQNPATAERIAIVAVGGYGRGELAPFSDLDLLFLRPHKTTAWGESVIEFILQMLWDLGFKVGHATRTIAETIKLAKADSTIRTALLEARHICGDAALTADLRKRYWKEVAAGSEREFVTWKLGERDKRHERQGESRYLVEPNLKEGKGGLRDLQTLYWLGKYLYRTDDSAELVDHGMFTRGEYKTFQKAEAFFWDVRFQLHYSSGRAEERLSFDMQTEVARRLGFTDENPRRAVERFMKAYFTAAKDVGDLTRIFCAALEEQNKKARPLLSRMMPGFLKLREGGEDFFVENGRLNARAGVFKRDPVNLIRIFHLADEKGVDVHPAALTTITRSLDLIDDGLRRNPDANRLFKEILTSRRDPEWALRLMNEAGVFGRFVPDFGRVVSLMQFNMYHHYTVDEHLIRAVGHIAAIERGERASEHPISSEIIKRIKSRDVLYCAILLHDIAKGLPGDHSDEGAAIAMRLCPRLGLSAEDTANVAWLVKNHLVMSDAAQRRDLSDPQTVRDFVDAVQSPEMLRLLLVLTVADIRAVGPGVWNGWKAQLLRELYHEAEAAMSGTGASKTRSVRAADARARLEQRLADFMPAAREHALARHSDAYWLAFDEATHETHARLMRDAGGEDFAISAQSDSFRDVTQIVITTPDQPGLFSKLAGAIALSGGSIVDAKVFTTSDRYALDIFSVQDADGGPFGDEARVERLRRNIAKTLAGDIAPRSALAKKSRRKRETAFKVHPRVNFDNEASALATIVEVEGLDRPGFLYDVTHAIFESGLSIGSSMVATYGERAVDVFYVRDAYGHKITHPERIAAVQARLIAALAGA